MASDSSMDIICDFNVHELTNAVDQARREISTRYDLKSLGITIDQTEDAITITTPSEYSLNAAFETLLQKVINRKLSPKILNKKDMEKMGGTTVRYKVELVKALDQESAKKVSAVIREKFPKVKPSIQGQAVRVTSKSRDELQGVIAMLRTDKVIDLPLQFTNYR
ncbi:MAG: hypothetical protein ACD_51C00182G0003 [uncultured bacterium]|nr:MAG: hypothetical protein ACD_51C00182G0003 [uncultured bacterium]OGJ47510.1 MAG: YajQ family cyclic di-GMP-binding protein [Candidatus Peregrinibacteria bacterium RIFOXYA2_FULL_41_18]OGJ52422.1 MAG: YajQ family cyclic di-GMP-binding protein [Candidatus Peregrinibacteria bacterium RIFOXYB2_FULL_41_88]OGJ52586.1 MAG: YajQ family cyclic di-GMP-binding protein [Candidatus Peregrinibacteria bacterium RIFOXYC2_FULL_41_22]